MRGAPGPPWGVETKSWFWSPDGCLQGGWWGALGASPALGTPPYCRASVPPQFVPTPVSHPWTLYPRCHGCLVSVSVLCGPLQLLARSASLHTCSEPLHWLVLLEAFRPLAQLPQRAPLSCSADSALCNSPQGRWDQAEAWGLCGWLVGLRGRDDFERFGLRLRFRR